MSTDRREPHAVLDSGSRIHKAMKIERLLSSVTDLDCAQVLEVGTGSGFIAAHFATLVGIGGAVSAVDVVDQRQVHEGYDFQLVQGTRLPFADESFDVCVSNHVLEHVGKRAAQFDHLIEIRRVLRSAGWLYLAVPNRWALVEPHFQLPLLSWLPPRLRDAYVRAFGLGTHYDCDPPSHSDLEALLSQTGYESTEVSFDGIKLIGEIENEPGVKRWLLQRSALWARPLSMILPSHLYLARPKV